MKKLVFFLLTVIYFSFVACKVDDCDPGNVPTDDKILLLIRNSNGTPFLNYPMGLPDSVKVTNLSTGTLLSPAPAVLGDSIIMIDRYNNANGATTKFKIQKGTILKPDTLELTVSQRNVNDNCGTPYQVAGFSQIKVNNITTCNNCAVNYLNIYTRQ